jgi:tetratricopeptide (TPR) repeat protein
MSLRVAPAGVAARSVAPLLLLMGALLLAGRAGAQIAAPVAPDSAENAPPAAADDDSAPLPMPPVPPRIADGAEYGKCLDMLATDPSGADAMATTMAANGGGEGAQHCHALAQVELGNTEAGAALLDHLATASLAPAASRAVVFGQASQAWMMSGKADQAYASASQALALAPDEPDLLIARAIAGLALARYAEAADDLTHALALDPKRADALIMRATARRNLKQLQQAQSDIDQAFALDPTNPDGLLERGIIRQRLGDLTGARADWQQAADLAADTPTGDLAQQNLALLEAGPRQ